MSAYKIVFKFKIGIALLILGLCYITTKAKTLPFITEKEYDNCFPLRNSFYSYSALSNAYAELALIKIKIEKRGNWIYKITRTDKKTAKSTVIRQDKDWEENWAKAQPYSVQEIDYENFCSGSNPITNKKELAAFFAHIAHETRNGLNEKFNDGLMLLKEKDTLAYYSTDNVIYEAVKGKKYYGRGPLQLSFNGNYGFASHCIFGDKNILLNNPDLITSDPILAFKTAIYFWMTPQSLKPAVHEVITELWKPNAEELKKGYKAGFGTTINIINGALECNQGENQAGMKDRISFYQHFLTLFNLKDPNCSCSCANVPAFGI